MNLAELVTLVDIPQPRLYSLRYNPEDSLGRSSDEPCDYSGDNLW